MPFAVILLSVLLSSTGVSPSWGDDVNAVDVAVNSNSTPASEEQIQRWIHQLGSNRYVTREKAARDLVESGIQTVEPLVASMSTGSIEMRMRALNVLRDLAMLDREDAFVAEAAIHNLAATPGTAVAERAATIEESLREVRQARAQRILRRYGASFSALEDSDEQVTLGTRTIMVSFDKGWRGKLEHLKYLEWLYEGVKVRLRGEMFTDDWFKVLMGKPSIAALELNRTQITDEAFAGIAELPRLQALQIRYCEKLTNKSLKHLEKNIESLQVLKVFDAQITKPEFELLVAKNPACRSRYGRGGFLGIGGMANTNGVPGCLVTRITPNKPASIAGIRVYDIITAYNGKPVDRFTARIEMGLDEESANPPLSELIAKDLPGDQVKVTLLRSGRKMELDVTLGEWD